MGRFTKDGVDYFTLECHLEDNVKLVEAEFGIKGFGVIIKLWQKIYSDKGYYTKWSRPVALLFSRDCGVSIGVVEEVVKASLREGIFDQKLYDTYGILTSRGIQKRYAEATRKRELVKFEKAYLLIAAPKNAIYSDINEENTARNEINGGESKEKYSKVDESTVEERKEEERNTTTTTRNSGACARENEGVENSPPGLFDIVEYFEASSPIYDDKVFAINDAKRFWLYNEERGWDCLPNWEKAAELWIMRADERERDRKLSVIGGNR